MELTPTAKLDAFFAMTQHQSNQQIACARASSFSEDTRRIVVADAPINKRITDIASKILEAEVERNDLVKNVGVLRKSIDKIISANQVLSRLVTAKNKNVLDVMGVFSEFRIPGELTDLASEDIAPSTRPVVRDSIYRNTVRDFVSFVTSKGYVVSREASDGISTKDIAGIIAGIRTARMLKSKYGVKTTVSAIRESAAADERINELSREIAELNEEQDKLGRANQDKRTQTVTLVSEISKKQEEARTAALNVQRLSAEIAELASKADTFRSVRNMTQVELKAEVVKLKSSASTLRNQYQELVTERKLLSRTSKATRDQKALDLQEQALERKRAEKTLQLQGKYGRLPQAEAKLKIKKELAAWEKVQREQLAEINRVKGRIGTGNNNPEVKNPDQLSAQLDNVLQQMQALDAKIQILQQASMLTQEERMGRLGKISDAMALKKQELKNKARMAERRETSLKGDLDPDLWETRIEEKMEDQRFVDQARRHHPLHAIFYALDVGVDQKTKRMMDIAWSYFKRGATFKLTRTLKKQLKSPAHFGAKGFIVDPRFPRINSELITILSTAINEAYKKLTTDDLAEFLLPAVMDTLTNTPTAMAEHKAAYKQTLLLINKQLAAPKTQTIMHEIIEDLIADGRISSTSGAKPTKKFVTQMVDDFIGVIRTAKAPEKLAAFAWAGYREDMSSWIRNTFKVTKKKSAMQVAKKGF